MIFLTVGTLFSFDRLVQAVDAAVGMGWVEDEVFAQTGTSQYTPKHMKHTPLLSKEAFNRCLTRADYLIGHAGIGSITMALHHHKPILVMPRLKKYGEHVNDHQWHTALKFESLGHILVAREASDLPGKLVELRHFKPTSRISQAENLSQFIGQFLRRQRQSRRN